MQTIRISEFLKKKQGKTGCNWPNRNGKAGRSPCESVQFLAYEAGYCCGAENFLNVQLICIGLDYSCEATASFASL